MTLALAEAGVRVALVGRDEGRLRAAVPEGESAATHMLVECDVRESSQVRAMVDRVTRELSVVDILINSAGVYYVASMPDTTDDMWDDLWRTNVNGTFFATRAVLPGMLERERGTIVMLSSVAAHRGFGNTTGYSATKHAVQGLARSLTTEVRRHGVRVVNVAPGPVDTPIWADYDPPLPREDMLTPEEVARTVMSAISVSGTQVMEDVLLLPQKGIYF
jgi:NAD(P)-dependent dehydrogenase (short-subunit alcohol dehydrogenase family)